MQRIILKRLRRRLSKEVGDALATALIHESHARDKAFPHPEQETATAAHWRAHAERLTQVLTEYDRLEKEHV